MISFVKSYKTLSVMPEVLNRASTLRQACLSADRLRVTLPVMVSFSNLGFPLTDCGNDKYGYIYNYPHISYKS
jgi:hypothetical protein